MSVVSTSPHITKKGHTTRNIMLDVLIALSPACIASILLFGHLVAVNIILCVGFCMGFELLYNLIISKKWNKEGVKNNSVWDLSSAVTGTILALNLPTYMTIFGANAVNSDNMVIFSGDMVFACFLGSLVAIVLVKMLFGGIGKNFANPAAVGRIFLVLAFTFKFVNVSGWVPNGVTGATPLSMGESTESSFSLLDLFLGTTGSAAVGETCIIAILLGYVYLCIKKVIDFRVPLMVLLSAAIFSILFKGLPLVFADSSAKFGFKELCLNTAYQLLSGGLMFGAVFMATDYSTSPNTFKGNLIYAAGIGMFTMLIRVFGAYPEGFSFALVIMNILTPIIDKYIRNRPFGYAKNKSKSIIEAKNASVQTDIKDAGGK